jgi:hypothetical protein
MAISYALIGTRGTSATATVATGSGTSTGGANSTGHLTVSFDRGATITSVTDNKSNAWVLIGVTDPGAASAKLATYKCEVMTGGAAHIVTVNFSGTAFATVHFHEALGSVGAVIHDAAASVRGTNTQASAGATYTITSNALSQANSLIICGLEQNQGTVGAYAFSPQTLSSQEPDVTNFWTSGVAAQVVVPTTAVTTNVTRTGSSASTSAIFIDVFNEASGVAAAPIAPQWDFDSEAIDDDIYWWMGYSRIVTAAVTNRVAPQWDFDVDNVDDDWSWWLETTQSISPTGSSTVAGNSVGATQAVISFKSSFATAAQSIGSNQGASSVRAASTTAANSAGAKQSATSTQSTLRSTIAAQSIGVTQSAISRKASAYSVAQSVGAKQSAVSTKSALTIAANSAGARQNAVSSSVAPRLTNAAQSIGARQSINTAVGGSSVTNTGGGGKIPYIYSDEITQRLLKRFDTKAEQTQAKRSLPKIGDVARKAIKAESERLAKQPVISLDDVLNSVKVSATSANFVDLQPLLVDWVLYYLRVNAHKAQLQNDEDEAILLLLS